MIGELLLLTRAGVGVVGFAKGVSLSGFVGWLLRRRDLLLRGGD
jgi:hypothetical protein